MPPQLHCYQSVLRTLPPRLIAFCVLGFGQVCFTQLAPSTRVNVHIVSDEADAVLSILTQKKANQPITDADWQRLFSSEGYNRLKKREAGMRRSFEDADFRAFVLSDQLAQRAQALAETLSKWERADLTGAAGHALAYLPARAHIRANIYPVIKPAENSFVFEVDSDPAIFLYLDPKVTKEKFENTVAHEFHHIGYGSSCPSKQVASEISRLPQNTHYVINWVSAFGEGFAMLAAAGGPDVHPHAVSSPEDRERWDRDMSHFNDDLKKVEGFFLSLLSGRLNEEERRQAGFAFFGVQGPWYTVGWKMSVLIEKTYGRAKLIECICDQRKLLPTYNDAAAKYNRTAREPLALWSASLISSLK